MARTNSATLYQLGFQISPIILTGGVAALIPGGMLPIIALTEAANFTEGLLAGDISLDPDEFFAHFNPMPGGVFALNEIATYPFANMTVAANSIIAQPLRIPMLMQCPAKGNLGFLLKLATMTALKKTLDLHNSQGGTYIVVTPSYIYQDCLMESMVDATGSASRQYQYQWQLNFVQPLVTASQAASAQSAMMSKLTAGTKQLGTPTWSGVGNALSSSVGSGGQTFMGFLKSLIGSQ